MEPDKELWLIPGLNRGLYTSQVQDYIIDKIEQGKLKPFDLLPPYRLVAKKNNINKNVVMRAYARLTELGWLKSRIGSGTQVSPDFPGHDLLYPPTVSIFKMPVPLHKLNLELIKPFNFKHTFVSVGFDVPSPQYFPSTEYYKRFKVRAGSYATKSQVQQLTYLNGQILKNVVLEYNGARRSFSRDPDCMHIITSRTECLTSVFCTLLEARDIVVSTSVQDMELNLVLQKTGAQVIYMRTLDPDLVYKLTTLLEKTKIKAFYLRPECSYPEGNTLSAATCEALLNIAKANRFYIVEEDDQHEFLYDYAQFKPLINYAHEGHVIYIGALSMLTTYAQTIRTILAAAPMINRFKSWPLSPYSYRNIMNELVIADLLNTGEWTAPLHRLKAEKTEHRFQLNLQLENYVSGMATIYKPVCGLTFWLHFHSPQLLKGYMEMLTAIGKTVPYLPYSQRPNDHIQDMRLGFGSFDLNEVEEAAKIMYEKFNNTGHG
ncbi:GntR family transcriptional regulator/MocR family aminotransferase [Pedobacter sp. AK017]|uniref:GntR family transcriptional regulator n=1 Tax=Pedobacter sp. AK017 TaxID=2723073 RepID=UPI00161F6EBB|nr:PLP-dependent aminotransferase family protein [Pedobacter sp. AK017]MBB5437720.1 GntR family transcriptional regulator/MocR family aminotransferase [Pedobacter sp. AK017]